MTPFTLIHVAISLVAIFTGIAVLAAMLANKMSGHLTAIFLGTTLATSLTGFCYLPFLGFSPGQAVGILSVVLLSLAIYGFTARKLLGAWRLVYVITSVAALYLNVFVLVVQGFQKIPALKALAPTQSEPPFAIAQGLVLLLFIGLGTWAARKFHPVSTVDSV